MWILKKKKLIILELEEIIEWDKLKKKKTGLIFQTGVNILDPTCPRCKRGLGEF